jgi:hypothetical protein
MVSLVTQMLDLHQRLHAATSTSDRELLQRQTAVLSRCFSIDVTDKTTAAVSWCFSIDELVATRELYGLTEEEMRMVEG